MLRVPLKNGDKPVQVFVRTPGQTVLQLLVCRILKNCYLVSVVFVSLIFLISGCSDSLTELILRGFSNICTNILFQKNQMERTLNLSVIKSPLLIQGVILCHYKMKMVDSPGLLHSIYYYN